MMIFVRSLVFNVAFYIATAICLLLPLPVYFILPQGFAMWVVSTWGRIILWLLRVIVGTRYEVRGHDNVPAGGILVASKHQSAWETFALVPMFPDPTFVIKSQLKWIPVWGQYTIKAGMIHVDRKAGTAALRYITQRAKDELGKGRQIVIFPEGTRRAPGAPPDYQGGVAHLYRALGVPVLPVALNSGLYWPRRKFLRYPGTIVVEFLPPLPPGLSSRMFLEKLRETIETASDRLLLEASRTAPVPPLAPEAVERISLLAH
jgi:1-acyl-sn-glycerol-3-phosphate acyltransferase